MNSAVVVFPGSNCDRDAARVLANVTGQPPHMAWHGDAELPAVDLIVIPGGFSYGDYLRPGAIAARSPVMKTVHERALAGVAVLGICNGFQVLTETGLLPGALLRNAGLRFVCRPVAMKVLNGGTIFTQAFASGQIVRMPVAHNDGNYFVDEATAARLFDADRVAFVYCAEDGTDDANSSPNGSCHNIAAVLNDGGNVMGMMPHPERCAEKMLGGEDGRRLFESLVGSLRG